MQFLDLVTQLKSLNLPENEYVVVGSGPLAAHNIREAHDFDLLVTEKLWNKLKVRYEVEMAESAQIENINIGDIQILGEGGVYRDESIANLETLLETADIIEEIPFINLNLLKKFKQKLGREKDLKDIGLIDSFLNTPRI